MSKGSEPAFPAGVKIVRSDSGDTYKETVSVSGLTKREYFAAMAMQGTLANEHFRQSAGGTPSVIAAYALEVADALLAALEKKE